MRTLRAGLLLAAMGGLVGGLNTAADKPDTVYRVAGLERSALIRIDRWGVPHISADSHYDAFFAQGFNAARDRLWQMDLWRRRGLGELSAVLGAAYIGRDRAARLFLYRADMYREWLAYGSDAKIITERFVAGVNAYIDLARDNPGLVPPEFGMLGYAPQRWSASDVVRIRSHGLWRNVEEEVTRAQVMCRHGGTVDAARRRLEPAWTLTLPVGTDPCAIPADVLRDYRLAKAPLTFGATANLDVALAIDSQPTLGIGSNNWVVAPQRTATGRPILADDPHRAHAVPSLRYMVHLRAPGLDVIGAGEPALPGISIGHNGTIAFGLTIFPIDQEDLYVYETNAEGDRYRYRGEWVSFERVTEAVSVRGVKPHPVTLEFTRHGPVIARSPGRAFVVRAAWLEPGMAPYFGSIEYMRARNWREFVGALNRWGAPSENQVYADTDGNIGYKAAGLFPRRTNWDGLLPVPGDGRYEWDGYFDMDALPEQLNPAAGFVATANAMNLPVDYPISERRIGFEWTAPWRHRRLHEVLEAQPSHTIADSLALQHDYQSLLAREVLRAVPRLADSPATQLLSAWDAQLLPQSNAAALFMVWYQRHLLPALRNYLLPADAAAAVASIDSNVIAELMARPPDDLLPILTASLDAAWADVARLLGDDPTSWQWGELHQMRFVHPLLSQASGELARQMTYPALPRGGSADTPNNTGYAGNSFDVAAGASFRIVVDVGNWDAARMTNAPGQSGDPRSPFYGNLLAGWAADDSFPLVYSEDAVAEHTVETIRLEPSRQHKAGQGAQ